MTADIPRLERPSRLAFERDCVEAARPAILTGLMQDWSVGTSPPLDRFAQDAHRLVSVWQQDASEWHYALGKKWVRAPLRHLLAEVKRPQPRLFGVQMNLLTHSWALDRFPVLAAIAPLFDLDNVVEGNLWLQGSGNRTHLHYDFADNVHFLIQGKKRFVVFPPDQFANLYPARDYEALPANVPSNWSLVDAFRVDHARFPLFADAKSLTIELRGGDTLYLPRYWWHYVATEDGPSCGINFWWRPPAPQPWPPWWRWYIQ
jgi:hypothetical protein